MGVKFMVKKRYVTLEWPLPAQLKGEHRWCMDDLFPMFMYIESLYKGVMP